MLLKIPRGSSDLLTTLIQVDTQISYTRVLGLEYISSCFLFHGMGGFEEREMGVTGVVKAIVGRPDSGVESHCEPQFAAGFSLVNWTFTYEAGNNYQLYPFRYSFVRLYHKKLLIND